MRGLHIVIINPFIGTIIKSQIFDTYESSKSIDEFIKLPIPENHIIIAACKDDCVTNLSQNTIEWFEKMGSKEIRNLTYGCGFSFISMGQPDANESRAKLQKDYVCVT